ncbi:hypothetical protein SAMN04515668_0548 [Hymenobacter arizonensis]|uniref:Uncharacterized protein n=1 Tax=Hymenobacter arizonensis TaxID=1227077 RepID=A0A1I5TPL1_HYMAR|nr:hypothetical protein SAMN04515668_0548 [Hymenobacter arizonensis]
MNKQDGFASYRTPAPTRLATAHVRQGWAATFMAQFLPLLLPP